MATALPGPCPLQIRSDAQLVVRAFSEGWLNRWEHNGYVGTQGRPVEHRDLGSRRVPTS